MSISELTGPPDVGVISDTQTVPGAWIPPSRRPARELLLKGYQAVNRRAGFIRWALRASDARYEARRARHAASLPELSREHSGILADLSDTGVAVRTVRLPPAVRASARRFTELLRAKRTQAPCVKTTSHELALDPTLFKWGLTEELLDLAESHIGLPPRYLGVEVKREMLNPAAGDTHYAVRRWHLDHEDRRIFKVIVYLSDVDATSGPFGYLDLPTSSAVLAGLGRASRSTRIDQRVRADVPPSRQRLVTGPAMTGIYVDTGRVVHRVVPPAESERYSVTFAYCGRKPFLTYSQLMLPTAALRALSQDLSTRQVEALCGGAKRHVG
jgi:hypothetical protein